MRTEGTEGAERRDEPPPGVYRIDPDASSVRFTTRAMFGLLPVRGTFSIDHGQISIAETDADDGSEVDAVIRAASFASGIARRDEHVRSADYLNAAAHPEIRFSGRGPRHGTAGATVHGELTVLGVTRPMVLTLGAVAADGTRLTVGATAVVDRYAFGMTKAKGMTGRRLNIDLEVVAVR
ncbi:YceI family protein [Streptomyces sp. NPDC050617]|uniref:YceI family protein n=1 Tax=Streptomyces sp. NPDC050617 TaxID=3154628 RepID=UPI003423EFF8